MADFLRLSLILGLVVGSYGCRACTSCYDYSSPVANSVYAGQPGRAGSVLSGALFVDRIEQVSATPPPAIDMSDLEQPLPDDAAELPIVEYAVAAESESIEAESIEAESIEAESIEAESFEAESFDEPVGINLLR